MCTISVRSCTEVLLATCSVDAYAQFLHPLLRTARLYHYFIPPHVARYAGGRGAGCIARCALSALPRDAGAHEPKGGGPQSVGHRAAAQRPEVRG